MVRGEGEIIPPSAGSTHNPAEVASNIIILLLPEISMYGNCHSSLPPSGETDTLNLADLLDVMHTV